MLKKLVGRTVANDLNMTGRRIKPDEAKAIGLVNEVYPAAEFNAKVKEYAEALAAASPVAFRAIKKLSNRDSELDSALKAEVETFADLWNYKDLHEGIDAFNNRRKPVFKGE